MRHNSYSTASRPSYVHGMVAPQKQLLHNLEHTFKVDRPLFLNSNRSWADTFLTRASQLTTRSIGRLRLDFDMNETGIQELWFDLETDSPEFKALSWVHQQWPDLRDCALRLIRVLCSQLPEERIYVSASGSGLHIRAFVKGITSEAHRKALLRHLVKQADLPNSKSSTKPGCDMPSTLSIRRKVREVGGPNADKRRLGKADYKHYCTMIPLIGLESLNEYPLCKYARNVAYPQSYRAVQLPDAWREEALPGVEEQQTLSRMCTQSQQTRPLTDFRHLLEKDGKLANLFYGKTPIRGLRDQSRSGREQSLVCKLVYYGFTFEQIDSILRKARIGKWTKAPNEYRKRTYATAGGM